MATIEKDDIQSGNAPAVAEQGSSNGFNDGKLTKVDSELVFSQLMQLDCARQY